MRILFSVLLLAIGSFVAADHIDVIQVQLRDDCTLDEYLVVVKDFNEWGEDYGYQTEIAVPLQNSDLVTMYWMGRSANAQAFGKAWDAWRDGQGDSSSDPAKLQARFDECANPNVARSSFDTY